MADELLPLRDRGKYYRALALLIRARIPFMQYAESRNELGELAADYERLAAYVDAIVKSDKLSLD